MLDNDICVFCFYNIKEWESNGRLVNKKDSLIKWENNFLIWRNHYVAYYNDIKSALQKLPKGVFRKRKIKGHYYYYLAYRQGKRVVNKYYGKQIPKEFIKQIELRKALRIKLSKINYLLYSLRISKRPSRKLNSYQVFKRDNFTCQYCGKSVKDGVRLHVDHIIPLVKGGDNSNKNLITSCQKCNLEKHDIYDSVDK